MSASVAVLQLFGGLVYLVMGGDMLVRGAIALARKVGVAPMVVGLTVVAFGTSAPELLVTVRAAMVGYPELAIANVVGSNIANVLLVVGLPAMVYPMVCDQENVGRDGLFMLFTTILFFALCSVGPLDTQDGVVLLAGLGLFVVYLLRASGLADMWSSETEEMTRVLGLPSKPSMIAVLLVLGILALPLGAELLIRGAVGVAELLGVSNSVIGLSLIALSTSLPELATTLVAALKREADVAVGNVLGSNVLNLFAVMGTAAVLSPMAIPVPPRFLTQDLPVMLGAALVLAVVTLRGGTVGRGLGAGLFGAYLVYVVVLFRPVG